ncbi:MAG: CAP domain-containing protein [Planctomycetota bacterium]|jgi:hypothetical protein
MRYALALASVVCLSFLPAGRPGLQDPEAEAQVRKRAVRLMIGYADFALRNKVGPKARQAYEEVIRTYEKDHKAVRSKLGYKLVGGQWMEAKKKKKKAYSRKRSKWEDTANDDQRYKVTKRWHETRMKLAKLHREHGLSLWESSQDTAKHHLELAVLYDPFDGESHVKLGHVKNPQGYYGTPSQIEFIANLQNLEKQALILAKKQYDIRTATELPAEMAVLKLEMHGAISEHFTVFTRGTQKNADDLVMWSERALDFLVFALGKKFDEKRIRDFMKKRIAWTGFIWTPREREKLIEANVEKNPGSVFNKAVSSSHGRRAEALFHNILWYEKGQRHEVNVKLTPAGMHDRIITVVWGRLLDGACNAPLIEGALHAATWYMMSTAISKRGSLPTGTVGEADLPLPESVSWWMREMRDQAIARTDMPINEVPRIDMSNFPAKGRLKAWSFMTWLMARYPGKWYQFLAAVPRDKRPFPSEVDEVAEKVFERKLKDIEEEWREWASGRSITAAVTGYGPPLLPPIPNPEQIAGLRRLNEFREMAGLPKCELDLEATMACVEHAKFLARHKEHHVWPEAHEQDPAKEGFTPRGMRAGMRSVIVIHAREAAHSVDSWIGTVYHRFPLLQENIKRIGFAFETGAEGGMCVLDMGSLEEPHAKGEDGKWLAPPYVIWPPHESKGWPIGFAYYEMPSPIAEAPGRKPIPIGGEDPAQKDLGYPISLQLAHYNKSAVEGATINLYETRKQGGKWVRKNEVPLWVHTPQKALLPRQEVRDTIFAIPKVLLKRNTWYQAIVNVKLPPKFGLNLDLKNPNRVEWVFKTGTKRM